MADLFKIVDYLDGLLNVASFNDYAPNGLQIEGRRDVKKIVTGVTACQQLIESAVRLQADAILVHHGYFWRGESSPITGLKYQRIKTLIKNDISLIAYHLPLDAHNEFGNNAQLAAKLDLKSLGRFGSSHDNIIAMHGELNEPIKITQWLKQIEKILGRTPLHLPGHGENVKKIAWCTGAAQNYFENAIALGVDVYISGEVSELTTHLARESGVHYIAAGHHATERYGVQALGAQVAMKFDLQAENIDIDNPV